MSSGGYGFAGRRLRNKNKGGSGIEPAEVNNICIVISEPIINRGNPSKLILFANMGRTPAPP
jgi:hypothetical protein